MSARDEVLALLREHGLRAVDHASQHGRQGIFVNICDCGWTGALIVDHLADVIAAWAEAREKAAMASDALTPEEVEALRIAPVGANGKKHPDMLLTLVDGINDIIAARVAAARADERERCARAVERVTAHIRMWKGGIPEFSIHPGLTPHQALEAFTERQKHFGDTVTVTSRTFPLGGRRIDAWRIEAEGAIDGRSWAHIFLRASDSWLGNLGAGVNAVDHAAKGTHDEATSPQGDSAPAPHPGGDA